MMMFNRYEYHPKTDLISKGGGARVYKALDVQANRYVALKFYSTNGELSNAFFPPANKQRLPELRHDNLCPYLTIEEMERDDAFGEKEHFQIAVMEFLDGGNLAEFFTSRKSLDIFEKLLRDIISGLAYLHQNGIIHRNIKASNILIQNSSAGPIARISDFGVNKTTDYSTNSSSTVIASIPYLAPEQLNLRKFGVDEAITYNIDCWSLGVLVYELISGEVLFRKDKKDSRDQIIQNILSPEPPPKIDQLPQPFRNLVRHCLVKDARLRVQKATELAALLEPPAPEEKTADFDTRELMPETAPAEEDTQILPPKWPSADETQVLPSKSLSGENTLILPSTRLSGDDTHILPSKPPSADDTHVLPSKRPSADDTQILPSTLPANDDTQILQVPVGSPPAKEAPLTLFNRYEYHPNISLIGKGGFSRVYKAFDRRLDRWVALKIYKGNEFLERYSPIAEIRRVINLDHPNICRYLDIEEIEKENGFGEKETTQICVMELLDGGNFAQYYAAHPEEKVIKKLLNDVLTGLAYLHKNGMIHRDIKPANILIKETMDGPVAKITDFGISKLSNSINSNSSSALIVSIPYMAPEQLNAKKYGINENISFNLDLWSLGVTIYEVITNDILFRNSEQDSSEQIMTNIMAPELPAKVRELPQPFRDIVSHCIVKDARNRAQRAEELIAMLQRNNDEKPAMQPPSPPPSSSPPPIAEPVPKPKKFSFLETPKEDPVIVRENPLKPPSPRRPERLIRRLTIAIATAAAIFCIVLYFYLDNKKKEQLLLLPGKRPDSVSIVSTVPVQNETPKPKPTPQDSFVVPPVEKVDNKPRETTNPPLRREAETTHPGSQKYVLRLTANENCRVKIGDDVYELNKDQQMKVRLIPGQYTIQATGTDNPKLTYLGSLAVTEKDMGRAAQYKILLHP